MSAHELTIVGAGLAGVRQLSREADEAVRGARVVFCSTTNAGMVEHVRALAPGAIVRSSEEGEYRLGMSRPEMYERMARVVLDAAREGPGVVVLCPGSAVVVDRVTQIVLAGAHAAGVRVRVLPGISSIESVLAEVGYDAAEGLRVVLAQKLVLHRVELDPTIATIVMQPAYYDTKFFAGAPRSLAGRFDALEHQLARSLGADAPIALVITPTEPDESASVLWLRIASLGRIHRAISPRHTMFVPPRRAPEIDEAFAGRIASWEACLERVEVDAGGRMAQQRPREVRGALTGVPQEIEAESAVLAARWRARPI